MPAAGCAAHSSLGTGSTRGATSPPTPWRTPGSTGIASGRWTTRSATSSASPDPFPVEPPHEEAARTDHGLGHALARLNPAQHTSVVLVHVFGWSYADVAEVIDAPVSSVRNHVHRGLRNLRQLLEGS